MKISPFCGKLIPYEYGEQPQDQEYIKLNTNESPFGPGKKVKKALTSFNSESLKLYSDPNNVKLKTAISEAINIPSEYIFVGNGSDEILAFAFAAFFKGFEKPLIFPDITYSFYNVYCNLWEIEYKEIPLLKSLEINLKDYTNNKDACGIVIANPNAPTGICLSKKQVEKIIGTNKDKVVLIDEAYIDFSKQSVTDLVLEYDNLIVVRTFSKAYSLAGIRCGYAVANPLLVNALNTIKNSFNSYTVDKITEDVVAAALSDKNYFKKNIKSIINTRDRTSSILKELGFEVLKSSSNFIFAKHFNINGKILYSELKKEGILVRHFDKKTIDEYIRITVGKDSDMDIFIEKLKNILKRY